MNRWRIMFDYDDTLIRHDNNYELKVMTDYMGVEFTPEIREQLINLYRKISKTFTRGIVTRKKVNNFILNNLPLLNEYDIPLSKFLEAQIYKDWHHYMLIEGAKETLEYLKSQGYFLCIFTNWFYDEQVSSLRAQGIYDYFDKIFAWDDFYAKPDERAFVRALDETDPKHNIMIGNNLEYDIIPAKQLGIYTFGVNLNHRGPINPDVELNNLISLKKYL